MVECQICDNMEGGLWSCPNQFKKHICCKQCLVKVLTDFDGRCPQCKLPYRNWNLVKWLTLPLQIKVVESLQTHVLHSMWRILIMACLVGWDKLFGMGWQWADYYRQFMFIYGWGFNVMLVYMGVTFNLPTGLPQQERTNLLTGVFITLFGHALLYQVVMWFWTPFIMELLFGPGPNYTLLELLIGFPLLAKVLWLHEWVKLDQKRAAHIYVRI